MITLRHISDWYVVDHHKTFKNPDIKGFWENRIWHWQNKGETMPREAKYLFVLDWVDTLILFKGKAFTVFEQKIVSINIFSKFFHWIVWNLLWAAKKSDKLLPSSKSDGFQYHNHNRWDYFCSTTETDYFPMFFRWKIIANNVLRWLSIICPTMRWNCCIGQV